MSTTLEPMVHEHFHETTSHAEHLRETTAAIRLSFNWFGTQRTLSNEQKSQAADTFGAQRDTLSAAKKLIDTTHPVWKEMTGVRRNITSYWKSVSLPYPENAVRLIRQDRVSDFNLRMEQLRDELADAAIRLDDRYDELVRSARDRLGQLFNPMDYPRSLSGEFQVSWDYPSVDVPDYLRRLDPELYQEQSQRVRSRFDEAVRLAEEAFITELSNLVTRLADRLGGTEDGRPKVFRDTAVTNLSQFFQQFRDLNIHSSEELDRLVDQASSLIQGVRPQQLRDNEFLRDHVSSELSTVQASLDRMMLDRPRRSILR
jgi:hypothetical protein